MVNGQDLFRVSDEVYVPPGYEILHKEPNGYMRLISKVHTPADAERRTDRLNQAHKCQDYSWRKIEDDKENT